MNNPTFTLTHDGNDYQGKVCAYGRIWLSSICIDKRLFASDGPTRYHAIANLKAKVRQALTPLPKPRQYSPSPYTYRKDPDPFLDELELLTWNADHGLPR
ncbi:hypothetical protein [Picosynechococcus sp. PCC 7117]|uniref:hypothetical protein n=1 Tax=Picosynechococcus sp. PCC 7117 TaxID=195498 RepID=UPI000810EE63|nr:hypothetical protein [Picosynechococcus sp. PCC 7117]ANV88890.1 hypothetical protein AWQ22_14880 [Picosynechococcus sp. PCC 7117]